MVLFLNCRVECEVSFWTKAYYIILLSITVIPVLYRGNKMGSEFILIIDYRSNHYPCNLSLCIILRHMGHGRD